MSIEVPVTTRHHRDMTERLLKATNVNHTQTHCAGPCMLDINHIYLVDQSILINWMSPFLILGVPGVLFSFLFYSESIFLLANSEDPDQTPRSVASDLGLHYLPMSQNGTLG